MRVENGRQILIVEDHPETEELVRMVLEEEGYRVQSVDTGRAAIRKIASASKDESAQFRPDLILLDLRLPDMDGVEVVKELRQDQTTVPPVVFVSADPAKTLTEAANSVGASAIRKPFEFEDLFRAIEVALSKAATA
jgi:two-component system OmpR family response regulator